VVVALVAGAAIGALGLVTGLDWLALAFVAPIAYVAGVLLASLTHMRDLPLRSLLLLPGVLATMHLSWGTGFLRGIR
jgi:hypothetical protein